MTPAISPRCFTSALILSGILWGAILAAVGVL